MSELSEILKNEYKKKEEKKPIDFSMLMEMVEHLYDAIEPEVVEEEKESKDAISTEKKETESIDIALPFVQLSEAWGTPGSLQRTDITKFVERIGGASSGDPVATLRNRIAQLQNFATMALEGKGEQQPISQVISNILLLDTLAAIVTGAQYSASPAGFLFEAFLAAMAGGDSAQIPASQPGQEKTIADFTIRLPDAADGVPVSLKLLAYKGGGVHGSVSDLLNSFAGQIPEAAELRKAWGSAIGKTQVDEVRKPRLGPEAMWDPKTQQVVPTKWDSKLEKFVFDYDRAPGEKDAPVPSVADDKIVGMKYIIVLKTAGDDGVKLDFWEFDFTWEKFKIFQELGRVPSPGSGKTQFNLSKTDYIKGPKGHSGLGSVLMTEAFTLPSSNQVRLKAQGILKELYNDFYKILEALKTTTDNLNTYLANPEDKPAGNTAASAADELEKDITKTTE
jgi:hypothetical protein